MNDVRVEKVAEPGPKASACGQNRTMRKCTEREKNVIIHLQRHCKAAAVGMYLRFCLRVLVNVRFRNVVAMCYVFCFCNVIAKLGYPFSVFDKTFELFRLQSGPLQRVGPFGPEFSFPLSFVTKSD